MGQTHLWPSTVFYYFFIFLCNTYFFKLCCICSTKEVEKNKWFFMVSNFCIKIITGVLKCLQFVYLLYVDQHGFADVSHWNLIMSPAENCFQTILYNRPNVPSTVWHEGLITRAECCYFMFPWTKVLCDENAFPDTAALPLRTMVEFQMPERYA